MLKMPRDGAILFSDLIGKLDALSVSVRNAGGMAAIWRGGMKKLLSIIAAAMALIVASNTAMAEPKSRMQAAHGARPKSAMYGARSGMANIGSGVLPANTVVEAVFPSEG